MVLNKKLLTMEDANSILQHFTKGFLDYYYVDTRDLTTQDNLFAYDFIDIIRVEDNIKFTIANDFWTKGYKIEDCNINDYSVTASGNEIDITGTGLEWVKICLEMSSNFKHTNPSELEFIIEYTGRIKPFFAIHQLSFKCLNNNQPVVGHTFTNPSTGLSYDTNSDGRLIFNMNPAKPGERELVLTTVQNNTTLTYRFPFIYIKTMFPLKILNDNILKDKNNILSFKFLYDESNFLQDEMFFNGNHIQLKTGNNSYDLDSYSDGEFSFNVPVSGVDKLNMEVFIEGNDYIERYSKFFEVDTSYVTFDNTADLKAELESENCARTVLYNGDSLNQQININHDVNIIFNGDCESSLNNIFDVNNNAKLGISNIIFTGENLVNLVNGEVSLKNDNFIHCSDKIIKGSGNLNIDNCGFIDNSSCVEINGNVNIKNTSFELGDEEYVDTSLVPFLSVYGDLNFDYCDFNIDLHDLEELGYAYVCCKIGGEFQTNGIKNNLLKKNDQFKMLNNKGTINVTTDDYQVSSTNNKAMTWNPVNTNTVFNNNVRIDYIGGD